MGCVAFFLLAMVVTVTIGTIVSNWPGKSAQVRMTVYILLEKTRPFLEFCFQKGEAFGTAITMTCGTLVFRIGVPSSVSDLPPPAC